MKVIPSRNIPAIANLIVFQMCAHSLSFTKVDKKIGLSQGAVSRQVIELEDYLRQDLFVREQRSLKLTDSGRRYAELIEPLLIGLEDATNELRMKHAHAGLLHVSISISLCYRWLVPKLPDLVAKHPEILVNLNPAFGYNIHDVSKNRDDDVTILISDKHPPESDDTQLLLPFNCMAMCAPALLGKAKNLEMAALLDLPLLHQKELPGFWQNYLDDAGYPEMTAPVAMVNDSLMVTIQSAVSGLGVALLPIYMVESELENGQLVIAHSNSYASKYGYYIKCNESRRKWPPLNLFKKWIAIQAVESNLSSQSIIAKLKNQI